VEATATRMAAQADALHARTAESRFFLCRETANLYGLVQRKRRKGAGGRDAYFIGGVPIVDIRDINSMSFPSEEVWYQCLGTDG
jgi:Vacuolar sorting 38 and autophagy-related subunit 14